MPSLLQHWTWQQSALPGSPRLAGASIYYPGGSPGSSQPPPSSQHCPQHWPSRQSCCPLSLLRPPLGFQTRCFPVLPPLPQNALSALPQGLRPRCRASNFLEGTLPPPLLGNSCQECRSPCCHLLETRPPFRLGHILQYAECLGENWLRFPQYLQLWEKCCVYCRL